MCITLPDVLRPDELRALQAQLGASREWVHGSRSAGAQAVAVKDNEQWSGHASAHAHCSAVVKDALQRDPVFLSAVLPAAWHLPRFNRYTPEHSHYGPHVDNALLKSAEAWVRGDISCTLFLSDPEDYDGGELLIQEPAGARAFKLPAGHALVYPSTYVHEVRPVTRGQRLASFMWIQSWVRDVSQRALLFEMDQRITHLRILHGECSDTVALTGVYNNLLRMWSQP